ncbi:glutaredoxin [Sideroxydans lithotrophicus ES-1]|uniref:Glutaredoxin n=2 Tax=Sideroxydans TaxID=314343 RepID=D5CQD3_SIDLE|nr:glutaredoxin [Sideroxydans lithotrophicus ES-1]
MKKCLLLLSLLMFTNAHAGELYRSIDSSGKVHYGDSPLQDSEDVEELKVGKEPTPDEPLPYETQRAKQNFPVTLYTFPGCGSGCDQARDLLSKRGVPFTEKSLVQQEDIEAFRKASGDSQIPAVSIGNTWVKGFLAEQWNNELDIAGYPKKVLTYRPPRPATPAAAQPAQ